jgi:hypothetical protein
MYTIPFQTTKWADLPATEHQGETGSALMRTKYHGDLRVRMVEYSAGYKADHWCELGHLLFCLEGELETELRDGSLFRLTPGMSYEVSDRLSSHKSMTTSGAKLIIIDGGFLRGDRVN